MNLYQIKEEDLEVLERELPSLAEITSMVDGYNDRTDVKEAWLMVKQIISNIRWNYGPPKELHKID